jgi:glutathione S-transferase
MSTTHFFKPSARLELYAYAAACAFGELEKRDIALSADDYRRLRDELADLFYLRRSNFTITDLLASPYSWHVPPRENPDAVTGYPQQWGGGWSP